MATLRVIGDDLDPDEVTTILGCAPTYAQRRGQRIPTRSPSLPEGFRVAKFGLWRLDATEAVPEDFEAQLAEILKKVTAEPEAWQDVSRRFRVELYCGWFMASGNDGIGISSDALRLLGERGIALHIDIYDAGG
jgi:hypothetical protein